MANLPEEKCDPYDLMIASVMDYIVDELPTETLSIACHEAQDAEQFYVAIQASVELNDILLDHRSLRNL